MTLRLRSGRVGVAVVVALMLSSAAILRARDARTPLPTSTARWLYVRSPRVSKLLAMNYSAVVADSYWLRTIQHFGGDRLNRRDRPFELLNPLLGLTTSLDPHFSAAYRFGAIFLSEKPPGGPGRSDQAIQLLEKGMRVSPDRWQYAHDIGFVNLWHGSDPKVAADWFRRAETMPGAPNWLGPLAATMMMTGGDRNVARGWLDEMRRTATEEWIRTIAERRLTQLVALDQIDQLQAMVPLFQQRMRRDPTGWADFQAVGLLRGTPADPAGSPYVYFPASGRVRLDPKSPLGPLPEFPGSGR